MNIKEANDFLIYAAKAGNLNGVKAALADGASIHHSFDLALDETIRFEHFHITDYLISLGAKIHQKNKELLYIVSQTKSLKSLEYLKSKNIDLKGPKDKPFFISFMFIGDWNIINFFVENGADPRLDNDYPLRISARLNDLRLVAYFVKKEADIKAVNYQAVELALAHRTTEILEYLITQEPTVWGWIKKNKHTCYISPEALAFLNTRRKILIEERKVRRGINSLSKTNLTASVIKKQNTDKI